MKPPGQGIAVPACNTRRAVSVLALLSVLLVTLFVTESSTDDVDGISSSSRNLRFRSLQGQNCTLDCCGQYKPDLCTVNENTWIKAVPVPVQWILIVFLVCCSAIFSGLTLGLLSLDMTGLEIVMEGDDAMNAAAAKAIYPIRKKGNLVLCTLIFGNVAVNSLLSILMADIGGGLIGFLVSTFVIVIFGEILPQALCARYALEIGSRAIPIVKVVLVLFFPVAGPLAFLLDKMLGNELATTYSSSEMRKLLQIHVAEGRFDQETAEAMTGALKYKEIKVGEVMTPIEKTFMLNVDERLNFDCIATIFKTGYSRIPVYEIDRNNIIGILFTKDLIFVDPEDETPVRNFISIFGRGAHLVWPDDTLGDVLRELKQGRSHLAIVRDVNNADETQDPFYEIKGIITLEDIIEEILGAEIVDETDAFVDHTHSVRVDRLESFDWGRLRLLDSKIVDETLSYEEAKAVVAHLRTNYSEAVSLLSDKQLFRLVSETSVTELPTAKQEVGFQVPNDLIYEAGVPTDVCTLILSGKVTVLAGADKFRSDVSSWSVLASSALTEVSYAPDFTAFVSSGPCRCLRFTRDDYVAAVDASAVEKRTHHDESQEDSKHVAVDIARTRQSMEQGVDSAHNGMHTPTPHHNDAPHNEKLRATQARRNKLIAAFQHAARRSDDKKEESAQDDKDGSDDGIERASSIDEVRGKALQFLSTSERNAQGAPLAQIPSPTNTSRDDSQDEKANTDDGIGSKKRRPSAFEYIGTSQGRIQEGDKADDE